MQTDHFCDEQIPLSHGYFGNIRDSLLNLHTCNNDNKPAIYANIKQLTSLVIIQSIVNCGNNQQLNIFCIIETCPS